MHELGSIENVVHLYYVANLAAHRVWAHIGDSAAGLRRMGLHSFAKCQLLAESKSGACALEGTR